MIKTRIVTSDGGVYEQDVEGSTGYAKFRRLVLEKLEGEQIISESFEDDDELTSAGTSSDSIQGPASDDQFRCSSWESGLQLSSVKDIADSPLLWFYNIIGHRLRTLKRYFSHGNLVCSLNLYAFHDSII